MTIEDYERENRDLRRMNQRLKEQIEKALEAVAKLTNADSQQKL